MLSPVQCLLLQAWTLSLAGSGACSGMDTKSRKVQLFLAHSDNDNACFPENRRSPSEMWIQDSKPDQRYTQCKLRTIKSVKKQKRKNGSHSSDLKRRSSHGRVLFSFQHNHVSFYPAHPTNSNAGLLPGKCEVSSKKQTNNKNQLLQHHEMLGESPQEKKLLKMLQSEPYTLG